MGKLDILNFEILLGVWLKSQTQKMLEKRGWEQFLRRSIIILEENCGNVDDIYLVILYFQCNKQDMGVLRVISNRELSY